MFKLWCECSIKKKQDINVLCIILLGPHLDTQSVGYNIFLFAAETEGF